MEKSKHGRPQQIFSYIYKKNIWGAEETRSGLGSELEATEEIRKGITSLLLKYNIESLLDIPCGEFTWFRQMSYR